MIDISLRVFIKLVAFGEIDINDIQGFRVTDDHGYVFSKGEKESVFETIERIL